MRPFAAQVLVVALLGTGSASAQTPTAGLVLRWRAPQGCPSEGEVTAAVTRLLGRPVAAPSPRRVAVARIRQTRRGWSLRITVSTGATRRHRALAGDTCAEVSEAAALVLALAIDPDVAARTHGPPDPPPTPPPGPPDAPPPSAPSPALPPLPGPARGVPRGAAPCRSLAPRLRAPRGARRPRRAALAHLGRDAGPGAFGQGVSRGAVGDLFRAPARAGSPG